MKTVFVWVVVLLIFSFSVCAATISGIVYDEKLDKTDAIVEINTIPKQTKVAKDGEYSFQVPTGNYLINAKFMGSSVEEKIIITEEGNYIIDLILFPDLEDIPEIEENIGDEITDQPSYLNIVFMVVGALLIFIFVFYILFRRKKSLVLEIDDDLENLMKIIKKQGGRTTQKEIRKEIPLSEAKISLMIAELEHKGIIEKIKKGRGNIIKIKK